MKEVVVTGTSLSKYFDELDAKPTEIITSKELLKAACCNLSESFTTNASVDVQFQDAVTGAKQIQLLGLAGLYTQMMFENIPTMNGIRKHIWFRLCSRSMDDGNKCFQRNWFCCKWLRVNYRTN